MISGIRNASRCPDTQVKSTPASSATSVNHGVPVGCVDSTGANDTSVAGSPPGAASCPAVSSRRGRTWHGISRRGVPLLSDSRLETVMTCRTVGCSCSGHGDLRSLAGLFEISTDHEDVDHPGERLPVGRLLLEHIPVLTQGTLELPGSSQQVGVDQPFLDGLDSELEGAGIGGGGGRDLLVQHVDPPHLQMAIGQGGIEFDALLGVATGPGQIIGGLVPSVEVRRCGSLVQPQNPFEGPQCLAGRGWPARRSD